MQKHHLSLQYFRERLAHYDALPQLVILGLLSGIMTGLLMVLFRLAVELPLTFWLGHPDDFESLSSLEHFIWPVIGSVVLIVIFYLWPAAAKQVGMVNLFERLSYYQGSIPGKSLVLQFVSATVALVSGHSVGREGPAIFLGAACSSLLGQQLRLPNNSLRLLIGCGAAAAISAAFNTPLAGVIFAMEVILLEYTLIGFTPVIVAAVSADLVMRGILGHNNAFDVPLFKIGTLAEIPWVMLLGVVVGLCAAAFNHTMLQAYKL
ncbi:chloride channel protein, partial [Neptunomonas sp.]|uniref:chloride channel protein n=1 Tax=Neptunomonas sp. TaxID=1971898 RepID=UPI003569DD60